MKTVHVLDGANVIADITGGTVAYYTRGVNLLWDSNGAYYLFNAHGDVVAIVSSSTETVEYDAFGNVISGGISSPFMYCGEYMDSESGLYYLRARYYNPATGRFLTEDPIKAGLNWYAYCYNNPVMFIDPWGLFGWNEDDDHMFELRREVEDAGGSVSWNAYTSTATVSIYGVTVSFRKNTDGVTISNGIMQVRADVFYCAVVSAATEMVFMGGHNAFGIPGMIHTSVIIFVSPNSGYYNTKEFQANVKWGNVRYATIGGESSGGGRINMYITGDLNRPPDVNLGAKKFMQHLHTGIGMATEMFSAHYYYMTYNNKSLPYALFPSPVQTWYLPYYVVSGYNSNSYAHGLMQAAGLSPQLPSKISAPGWKYPISARYFGR